MSKINQDSATITLYGDQIQSPVSLKKTRNSLLNQSSTSQNEPRIAPTGVVTAGRGDEMLNILVNDSFSTNKSKKVVKTGKETGKGKKVGKKALPKAGYSAMEIL